MQKLTSGNLAEVMAYLMPEPEYNLFCIGDLERFGMESKEVSCYTADQWQSGGQIPYFILDYRGNYLVYSHREDYDARTVAEFFQGKDCRNISGKDSIVEKLLPYLKEKRAKRTYMARLDQVTEGMKTQAGPLLYKVKRLSEEDIPEMYELYLTIDEFSYTYRTEPKEKCYEDLRYSISVLGRSYGIFEDGKLAGIAQTSAENRSSAMVVGVAVRPEMRRKGYARAVVLKLCEDCLKDGMEFLCLFYDNPAAAVIYHGLGFGDLGVYTMLRDREKDEN